MGIRTQWYIHIHGPEAGFSQLFARLREELPSAASADSTYSALDAFEMVLKCLHAPEEEGHRHYSGENKLDLYNWRKFCSRLHKLADELEFGVYVLEDQQEWIDSDVYSARFSRNSNYDGFDRARFDIGLYRVSL